MTQDTLAIIWFGLWGLIWSVYFVLDGYSLGTGILFPFVSRNEQEERQLQEAIGPFWGANEVWLITAGGATFAAFPLTYALLFSYLYTPMFIILFALFFRAIGLEFMHKHHDRKWQLFWKRSFFIGSTLVPLLFGVAFANLFRGLPIDSTGYHGNLLTLLNPYGLWGGILFVSLSLLSGSLWVVIKTEGAIKTKSLAVAKRVWPVAAVLLIGFYMVTHLWTPLWSNFIQHPIAWLVPLFSVLSILSIKILLDKAKPGAAFAAISLSILTWMASGFIGLFPNMLPSRVDQAYSITLYQAAGSELNLKIMLFVVIFILPIVIAYQIWMQRIFRKPITPENAKGYQ